MLLLLLGEDEERNIPRWAWSVMVESSTDKPGKWAWVLKMTWKLIQNSSWRQILPPQCICVIILCGQWLQRKLMPQKFEGGHTDVPINCWATNLPFYRDQTSYVSWWWALLLPFGATVCVYTKLLCLDIELDLCWLSQIWSCCKIHCFLVFLRFTSYLTNGYRSGRLCSDSKQKRNGVSRSCLCFVSAVWDAVFAPCLSPTDCRSWELSQPHVHCSPQWPSVTCGSWTLEMTLVQGQCHIDT